MTFQRFFAAAGIGLLVATYSGYAQSDQVPATSIVTVLTKNAEVPASVKPQDFKIQVNGKSATLNDVTPLRGDRAGLELVILIDSGARNSLGRQLDEIRSFVQSLPPTTQVGIAYMQNGQAYFPQPLTADKAVALKSLHLPGGIAGGSASPYFCLSDLAKHWPSINRDNRREVVMITDGLDPYNRRYDPDDPYLQAAINDSIRAGLVVNSIFWHDSGLADRTFGGTNTGENLTSLITQATGGVAYMEGFSNPVSFQPYFEDLNRRFQNQYELSFLVPSKSKPEVENLKVKLQMPNAKLTAPQRVLVAPAGVAANR
ncbi:MAG TPA: hypothetical protein VGG15_13005 [Terriglobales bacterium]|jgi:hypothetical protein